MSTNKWNEKALGRSINGAGRKLRNMPSMRFDANAVDADGDGIVQEGTPFSRPATPNVRNGVSRRAGNTQPSPKMNAQTTRKRTGSTPKSSTPTAKSPTKPAKDRPTALLDGINKNANKKPFDAAREFGDYETEFPKHEVDGMMGRDSADLPKMREQMKKLIKMAQASGIREREIMSMSDNDLQSFWAMLNAKSSPDTRAQFLAMMLADFELGMRKLSSDRAKNGPAPYEDAAKVQKIVDYMKKKGRV